MGRCSAKPGKLRQLRQQDGRDSMEAYFSLCSVCPPSPPLSYLRGFFFCKSRVHLLQRPEIGGELT